MLSHSLAMRVSCRESISLSAIQTWSHRCKWSCILSFCAKGICDKIKCMTVDHFRNYVLNSLVIIKLQRLIAASDDEFEVFVTADGDTVWNGKEQDPEYVYKILEQMREEAADKDEEASEDQDGLQPLQDQDMFPAEEPDVRVPVPWIYILFFMCRFWSLVFIYFDRFNQKVFDIDISGLIMLNNSNFINLKSYVFKNIAARKTVQMMNQERTQRATRRKMRKKIQRRHFCPRSSQRRRSSCTNKVMSGFWSVHLTTPWWSWSIQIPSSIPSKLVTSGFWFATASLRNLAANRSLQSHFLDHVEQSKCQVMSFCRNVKSPVLTHCGSQNNQLAYP